MAVDVNCFNKKGGAILMKRKVLMVLAMVFMLIPVTSAFAEEVPYDILKDKPTNDGKFEATDGNASTYISVKVGESYKWSLSEDVTVYSFTYNLASAGGSVSFIDANGTVINTTNTSISSNYTFTFPVPLEGVREISISGRASVYSRYNELAVMATAPKSYTYPNIQDLAYSVNNNEATFTWTKPTGTDVGYQETKVYRDGELISTLDNNTNVFKDVGLAYDSTYSYKFVSVYADGNESVGQTVAVITGSEPVDETLIPPSNPTAVSVSDITSNGAKLSWTNSNDDDLDSVNIYKEDGSVYANIPVASEYQLTGLNPSTDYSFFIALVDRDGNVSGRVPINFTTLDAVDNTPPEPVGNVTVTEGNKALYISWERSSDSDVIGYDVYINGVKHNTDIIKNTFYTATGLENDVTYDVQVVAVDRSGNSSEVSAPVVQAPSEDAIPIFETEYSLADVAQGISVWFAEYWLILAFAISIPLSFYIASRVKLMFLE